MAPNYKFHKSGNAFLNGINTFDCNSIILYENDVWEFKYFGNSGGPNYNNMFYVKLNDNGSESSEGEWFSKSKVRKGRRVELI